MVIKDVIIYIKINKINPCGCFLKKYPPFPPHTHFLLKGKKKCLAAFLRLLQPYKSQKRFIGSLLWLLRPKMMLFLSAVFLSTTCHSPKWRINMHNTSADISLWFLSNRKGYEARGREMGNFRSMKVFCQGKFCHLSAWQRALCLLQSRKLINMKRRLYIITHIPICAHIHKYTHEYSSPCYLPLH